MTTLPEFGNALMGVLQSFSGDAARPGWVMPQPQYLNDRPSFFPGVVQSAVSKALDQFPGGSFTEAPAVALHFVLQTDANALKSELDSGMYRGGMVIAGGNEIHLNMDAVKDVIFPGFASWDRAVNKRSTFENRWDVGQRLAGFLAQTGYEYPAWEVLKPELEANEPKTTYLVLYGVAINLPREWKPEFIKTVMPGFEGHPKVEAHARKFVQEICPHELTHLWVDNRYNAVYTPETHRIIPNRAQIPPDILAPHSLQLGRLIDRLDRINDVAMPGFTGTSLQVNHMLVDLASEAIGLVDHVKQAEHARVSRLKGISEAIAMGVSLEPGVVPMTKQDIFHAYIADTKHWMDGGLHYWWQLAGEFKTQGFKVLPAIAEREVLALQAQVGPGIKLI